MSECCCYGTGDPRIGTLDIHKCDWCKGLEADNTRLREQRDAERGEVARLRERLEQEMGYRATQKGGE